MKLTLEGLKDRQSWEKAGITLPSYDAAAVAEATRRDPVWVHMGIGNIFRIFIGGIADQLLEEGLMDRGSHALKHLTMMWWIRFTIRLTIWL